MTLVRIPPGEFLMGSAQPHPLTDQSVPQHRVRITRPFYMAIYEVTQEDLTRVAGYSSSKFRSGEHLEQYVEGLDTSRFPVDHSTWGTATVFCDFLNHLPEEIAAGRVYRLPTEAEWEYACRAGTETPFAFGHQLSLAQANVSAPTAEDTPRHALRRPTTVGSYPPNAWGLYDMHGNVWEWCQDGMRDYTQSPASDPEGSSAFHHVIRGGAWDYPAEFARSDYRTAALREYVFAGFRVVCEIKPK